MDDAKFRIGLHHLVHGECWKQPACFWQGSIQLLLQLAVQWHLPLCCLGLQLSALIWLDADEKLGKKMLGPCGGGSVYVGGDGDVTAVAEGIENALSVRIMSGDHRARYFAALSATGMSKLKLPEDCGQLMVFADGDKAGTTAAYELGQRASLQGWNANTMIPPKDRDWNDELIVGLVGSI